jgi:DNA-binding NarL/FixJ family response regulator
LSSKRKVRQLRTPQLSKTGRKRAATGRLRSAKADKEILALVRTGVESFILKNATVADFYKTIKAVGEKEKLYAHSLTKSVFSRIVKEAIRKRNHGHRSKS